MKNLTLREVEIYLTFFYFVLNPSEKLYLILRKDSYSFFRFQKKTLTL